MVDAHLNEPTIEDAHEAYLKRWHLGSVQSAWNGRKPSLAQYKKRFGKKYDKRQKYLAKQDGETGSIVVRSADQRLDAIETGLSALLGSLTGIAVEDLDTEPEDVEILGLTEIEGDEDDEPTLLEKLTGITKPSAAKPKPKAKDVEPQFVKPENFDELPRSGQVYFMLHRAAEAGHTFAIVPLKRGVAAECISQIKDDGRTYSSVAANLVKTR